MGKTKGFRTVHIDGREWCYRVGGRRRRYTGTIISPDDDRYRVELQQIAGHHLEDCYNSWPQGSLNPGRVKHYIVEVILNPCPWPFKDGQLVVIDGLTGTHKVINAYRPIDPYMRVVLNSQQAWDGFLVAKERAEFASPLMALANCAVD